MKGKKLSSVVSVGLFAVAGLWLFACEPGGKEQVASLQSASEQAQPPCECKGKEGGCPCQQGGECKCGCQHDREGKCNCQKGEGGECKCGKHGEGGCPHAQPAQP